MLTSHLKLLLSSSTRRPSLHKAALRLFSAQHKTVAKPQPSTLSQASQTDQTVANLNAIK
jgi:protease II